MPRDLLIAFLVALCSACAPDEGFDQERPERSDSPLPPDTPDTFIGGALDLCVSSDVDPDSLRTDPNDPVVEYKFAGVVRTVRPEDGRQFARPWGNCSASSPDRFVLEDDSTGISWMLSFSRMEGETPVTIFSPAVGASLSGHMAMEGLRTGAMQISLRDGRGQQIFAATDLAGGLFLDEEAVFGFQVSSNQALTAGAEETACGPRIEIGMDVSCSGSEDVVSIPPYGEASACGGIVRNVSTWVPTGRWICSDLILPTIWYVAIE